MISFQKTDLKSPSIIKSQKEIGKINELPLDCLAVIFTFCEPSDVLFQMQYVSKKWREGSDHGITGLKEVKEIVSTCLKKLPKTSKKIECTNDSGSGITRIFFKTLEIKKLITNNEFPSFKLIQHIRQFDSIGAPSLSNQAFALLLTPAELILSAVHLGINSQEYKEVLQECNRFHSLKFKEIGCRLKGEKYITETTDDLFFTSPKITSMQEKQLEVAINLLSKKIIKKQ